MLSGGGGSIILQGISLYNHSPKTLCPSVPTPLWGKIYKKKFLDKINLNRFSDVCPTIFLEDVLMTPFLWCEAKKILAINRIYYFHRFVKTSVSRSHKLSSFYYEQITSGNILLQYLKNLRALFSYDGNLKLYMRTLLRIWCLTVFDKSEIRKKYEQQVLEMYNFYKDDYKKVDDNFWMKILILSFGKTKYVWRIFANQIYFKKNNREWMQRNKKIRGNSGWKNLKNHAANKN